MKQYIAPFRARFKVLLQYRGAALAGVITQVFWGAIKLMVLHAFFTNSSAESPLSFAQTVAYVWLGQALLAMFPWNGEKSVQELIQTGNVAYDLLRPMDLYFHWFCRTLAARTAPTLLRALPIFFLSIVLLPILQLNEFALSLPPSWQSFTAWFFATVGALLLSCALTMLLNITVMWTISGEGVNTFIPTITLLCSGMIIPLPLFPDWSKPFLYALPFAGVIDFPFRLYSGNLPPEELTPILLHQGIWIILIVALGRYLVSRGTSRLVIQGG